MEGVKVKQPQEMLMLTPQNPSQAKPSMMVFAKMSLKNTKAKNLWLQTSWASDHSLSADRIHGLGLSWRFHSPAPEGTLSPPGR